jgi:hypothetical protein
LMAAPLLTTTLLPGVSGFSSASRSQVNAILTMPQKARTTQLHGRRQRANWR